MEDQRLRRGIDCDDCGIRDLPGDFRYPPGCHWLFDDKDLDRTEEFVRCKSCLKVTDPRVGIYNEEGVWCRFKSFVLEEYFSSALDPSIPTNMWKLKQHFGGPFITTFPAELMLNITKYLRLDEVMLLRGVSRFFNNSIPPPTHQQLLKAETEKWASLNCLLTCGGCLRLRDEDRFSHKFMMPRVGRNELVYPGFRSGEVKAAQRFCDECGVRPLPREFRYWLGSHFYDKLGNEPMARCKRCGLDRPAPARRRKGNSYPSFNYYEVGLCEPCVVQEKGRGFLKLMRKRTWGLSKIEGLSTDLAKRIIGHLEFPERMVLRLVSWNMNFETPFLTHHELVLRRTGRMGCGEQSAHLWWLVRLRHESKFDSQLIMERQTGHQDFGMYRGGKKGYLRFCLDCGTTDFAEKCRVRLGDTWYDEADSLALDDLLDSQRSFVIIRSILACNLEADRSAAEPVEPF